MAAQDDYEIKIRITADTAQVAQIQGAFRAIGAQVEATKAQVATVGGAGAGGAADIGRLIGSITGFGIGAGVFQFVEGLKKASAEIEKISEALDKQGEQLLKNAQGYDEQARHAKEESDVLKLSDATLKDIETTRKTFNEISQKELGYAAQISDELQKQMLARQRAAGMGDYEAARLANVQTAFDQYQAAQQRGMKELLDAEKARNEPFKERIEHIANEIAEEKRKQAALAADDPGGYAKAANNLLKLNKELEETIKLEDQRLDKANRASDQAAEADRKFSESLQKDIKGAPPTVQRALMQEQAAAVAQAEGRPRDVAMFQRTEQALVRGMTPGQKEQFEGIKTMAGSQEKLIDVLGQLARALSQWQ